MNTSIKLADVGSPIGNLGAYISRVFQLPILSFEEEQVLAKKFFEQNDLEAARLLVLAHLRFVVKIARGYSGYGLNEADLIQEGNVGLMKAVKRFNPGVGVRLVTFAVHWIKAEIHEFIIRNWRIVKVATTKAQRKLFFNLRSEKKRLGWFSHAEVESVAKDLGVTPAEVMEMESRLHAKDTSFEVSATDDEEDSFAPEMFVSNEEANPAILLENANWSDQYQDKLALALQTLDERSREILHARWLKNKKATLHDLAAKYGVSAERVRQLEQNAIKKLKQALLEEITVLA